MINKAPKVPIRRKNNEPITKAELDELRMKYPGGFHVKPTFPGRSQRRRREKLRSAFTGATPMDQVQVNAKGRTFWQKAAGVLNKVKRSIVRLFKGKSRS